MDIVSTEQRSYIMSCIRGRRTKPEVRLYEIARNMLGPRRCVFRNYRGLLGTPDLYIPAFSLAVFLDGCFFHGCPVHGHIPLSNTEFWERKIMRNARRDRRYGRKLREKGISVWRFWEHDLKASALESSMRRFEWAIGRQMAKGA